MTQTRKIQPPKIGALRIELSRAVDKIALLDSAVQDQDTFLIALSMAHLSDAVSRMTAITASPEWEQVVDLAWDSDE